MTGLAALWTLFRLDKLLNGAPVNRVQWAAAADADSRWVTYRMR